eukprot:PhM_4_TR2008/c0_g2_i1/m.87820
MTANLLPNLSVDEDFRSELTDPNLARAAKSLTRKLNQINLPPGSDDLRSHRILRALTYGGHFPTLCNMFFGTWNGTTYLSPDNQTDTCWMSRLCRASPKSAEAVAVRELLKPDGPLLRILQQYSPVTPEGKFFRPPNTHTPNTASKPYEEYMFNVPVKHFSPDVRSVLQEIDVTSGRGDVSRLPMLLQIPFYSPPFVTMNKMVCEVPVNMYAYFMFRMAKWLSLHVELSHPKRLVRDDGDDDDGVSWNPLAPLGEAIAAKFDGIFSALSFSSSSSSSTPIRFVGASKRCAFYLDLVREYLETTVSRATYGVSRENTYNRITQMDLFSLVTLHSFIEVWSPAVETSTCPSGAECERVPVPATNKDVWCLYQNIDNVLLVLDKGNARGFSHYHRVLRLLRSFFLVSGASDLPLERIPIVYVLRRWLAIIAPWGPFDEDAYTDSAAPGPQWRGWRYTPHVLQNYEMYALLLDDFLYFLKSSQLLRRCDETIAKHVLEVLKVFAHPTLHSLLTYITRNANNDLDVQHVLKENQCLSWVMPTTQQQHHNSGSDDKFITNALFTSMTAQRAAVVVLATMNYISHSSKAQRRLSKPLRGLLREICDMLSDEETFPDVTACLSSVKSSGSNSPLKKGGSIVGAATLSTNSINKVYDRPQLLPSGSEIRRDVWHGKARSVNPLSQPHMYVRRNESDFLCGPNEVPIVFNVLMWLAHAYIRFQTRAVRQKGNQFVGKCQNGHSMQLADTTNKPTSLLRCCGGGSGVDCGSLHVSWSCPSCPDNDVYCVKCAQAPVRCLVHPQAHGGLHVVRLSEPTLCPRCCVLLPVDDVAWVCSDCSGSSSVSCCRECYLKPRPTQDMLWWVRRLSTETAVGLIGCATALFYFIVIVWYFMM